MKQPLSMVCAILVACVFFQQVSHAAETTAAEYAIRKSAQDFVEAWNHGNAEDIAAQWTPDGEYIMGHDTLKGREQIAKVYGEFFRAHPGSKLDVKIESIRLIAPTVAIEQGAASVGNSPNGPTSASSYTAVHVKQGDKWLMATVRESDIPSVKVDRDLNELAWLVGKWTASKDKVNITLSCDWNLNKHFLRVEVTGQGGNSQMPGGLQIIGRDPASGDIVSWFFSADGGYGTGIWQYDKSGWLIQTTGIAADGTPVSATNLLYRADKNVLSWQSFKRRRGDTALPRVKETVFERTPANN